MEVERDETGVTYGDGWNRGVAVGLTNKLQASDPLPKSNLAHLKVLQDVSCRNTELLVESPELPIESPELPVGGGILTRM